MKKVGILDPEGKYKNPLNGKKYSSSYKKNSVLWKKLPGYKEAEKYINIIKKNQVILVVSGTGSGKTVLFPKYTSHAFDYKSKIAISLPKQVIAQSAAEFAALTLDVELGKEVGYKYQGSPKDSFSNETKLLYATDGTIVANLLNDPLLKKYDAVVIDEVHERKIQIDFLLYLLKDVVLKRPEFKLILMSATIDEELFGKYFTGTKFITLNVSGEANFPIKSIFLQEDIPSYDKTVEKGIEILIQILEKEKDNMNVGNDIIFFVISQNDTQKVCDKLSEYIANCKDQQCEIVKKGDIYCATVFSGLRKEKLEYAQHDEKYISLKSSTKKKYYRKVVIATNVAESSLTIKGLTYVIDTGYELFGSFEPAVLGKKLEKQLISVAQAKQRMGRTGRTKPGKCYHLYSKKTFDEKMKKYPEPSIRTSDLTNDCLRFLTLKSIGSFNELEDAFDKFIEKPRDDFLTASRYFLAMNNIIDDEGFLTNIGALVSRMNVDNVVYGMCIFYSLIYNCKNEMARIISMMSAMKLNFGKLFANVSKPEHKQAIKKVKEKYFHYYGDHVSLLYLYQNYEKQKNKERWCKDNFLNLKILQTAENSKLIKMIRSFDVSNIEVDQDFKKIVDNMIVQDRIILCLTMAHKLTTATNTMNQNKYITQLGYSKNLKLSKNSFVGVMADKSKTYPKDIFYTELFISDNGAELNFIGVPSKKIIKMLE